MANPAVKTIQEEDEVQYQNLEDLSYFDDDKDTVALYVNNNYEATSRCGRTPRWTDESTSASITKSSTWIQ